MRICKIDNCGRIHYGRGMCSKHFQRWYRKKTGKKYLEYVRRYNKEHGIKSIKGMHELRFGGLRDRVLKRDGYKCVMCGMTDKEHLKKMEQALNLRPYRRFRKIC